MSDPAVAAALLRWLAKNPNCEVSFSGWDDEPCWQVHRVTGPRSDREWTLIGKGKTPAAALAAAVTRAAEDD